MGSLFASPRDIRGRIIFLRGSCSPLPWCIPDAERHLQDALRRLPFFLSCGMSSRSPLCWQDGLERNEPSRTNDVRLASKDAVTPHSFSRRCFLSRQAAKAQPTAWLSLSPWWREKRETQDTQGQKVTFAIDLHTQVFRLFSNKVRTNREDRITVRLSTSK